MKQGLAAPRALIALPQEQLFARKLREAHEAGPISHEQRCRDVTSAAINSLEVALLRFLRAIKS